MEERHRNRQSDKTRWEQVEKNEEAPEVKFLRRIVGTGIYQENDKKTVKIEGKQKERNVEFVYRKDEDQRRRFTATQREDQVQVNPFVSFFTRNGEFIELFPPNWGETFEIFLASPPEGR